MDDPLLSCAPIHGRSLASMSLSRQRREVEEEANSPSSPDSSVSPPVAFSREAAAQISAATAQAAAAGAASDQPPSELDRGALQQVLILLPPNVIVLAAKVLNKGWRNWVYQQLGSRRGKQVVISDNDRQSSYVPLWSIKQRGGLSTTRDHKALLAFGAAARGELEDLQWMISQGYLKGWKDWIRHTNGRLCAVAAEGGQLRVLEWLASAGYKMDEITSSWAAGGGQLEVLQWLRQKGVPCSARVLSEAIEAGPHMHVVDWALEGGCAVDAYVCAASARKGDLQLLQRMHAKGGSLEAYTCAQAAKVGKLEVLQWLREKGCPWDERTCREAASNGDFEVLQ